MKGTRRAAPAGSWAIRTLLGVAVLAVAAARGAPPSPAPSLLEAADWKPIPAAGVEMRLSGETGPDGRPALRIDWDFHGRGGWAAARRQLELTLPPAYELRLLIRGEGPANNLEVKLVDPSGDNVWWHVRKALEWPASWTPLRIKKRQISFAWGPRGGGELERTGALELAISAAAGGRGTLWVAGLALVPTAPIVAPSAPLRATATSALPGHPAEAAIDGNPETAWRPAAGQPAALTIDFGALRELGGATLRWEAGGAPRRFVIALSADGSAWETLHSVERAGGSRSDIALPEAEGKLLRVQLPADACAHPCGLTEVIVRPLAFGATPNAFIAALAGEAPRGTYPRGFSEAVYWTVVGAAGDPDEGLFSEDGALELGRRGMSLEPFVRLGDRLFTWADVTAEQSLAEDELPIPTVTWRLPGARLEATALATGRAGRSSLLVRYRLINTSAATVRGQLFITARPFQVNPPHQFLNIAGGVAPIQRLACAGGGLQVEGVPRVWVSPPPRTCGVAGFDEGALREVLARGAVPRARRVSDPTGGASAALAWDLELPPAAVREVVLAAPLSPAAAEVAPRLLVDGVATFAVLAAAERVRWREALDRVGFDLPAEAAPLLHTLRSNLAWIEIHRDGPAIQPGSRAYARSWIRDGALIGTALLRLRHAGEVEAYASWFADHQYPDGKVPCCVDGRGADPVPENDSHGELVHLIAETWRYTRDRAFAQRLFPHVAKAVEAIEALRQQRRTETYRVGDKLAFFGLLPESISHEGYSAKPVHSYWDDTFAYRGLDDAVGLAVALGHDDAAATWARRRDEFRSDLLASLARTRAEHHLDDLPGSVELADFDSTSTTTMLDPGGLLPFLPPAAVEATFERYWHEFVTRRDGSAAWKAYSPYELRHAGAFVRLGVAQPRWRDRAHELLAWMLRDQRPPGWNGWPEAVHHAYREPLFLGDLPHGWVGSDFIRSLLDFFVFERREDHALVVGAGIPASWLGRPQGVSVRALATPFGPLSFTLASRRGGYRYRIGAGIEVPPGGLVLVAPVPRRVRGALVDGRPALVAADGTVAVHRVPATVDLLIDTAPLEDLHGH